MIRACDICGVELPEYWMDRYNTGRTTVWVCPACKRQGIREVNASEALKKRPRRKEKEL